VGRYGAVIGAVGASNVTVTGGGLIDGQGWNFWALTDANDKHPGTLLCSRPHLIEFEHCTDVAITGLTLQVRIYCHRYCPSRPHPLQLISCWSYPRDQNSPFWTTHFIYSKRCRASELTILAPATRGNTDGVNPDSSTDVIIENCYISNGDDGVAIKSGLNEAGIACATLWWRWTHSH
jgi:polygalacturonase